MSFPPFFSAIPEVGAEAPNRHLLLFLFPPCFDHEFRTFAGPFLWR